MIRAGRDPFRQDLLARQAAGDMTSATRFYALENIARDGFPLVGGQTIDALVREGLVKSLSGRVPFELTVAGIDAVTAHRAAQGASC